MSKRSHTISILLFSYLLHCTADARCPSNEPCYIQCPEPIICPYPDLPGTWMRGSGGPPQDDPNAGPFELDGALYVGSPYFWSGTVYGCASPPATISISSSQVTVDAGAWAGSANLGIGFERGLFKAVAGGEVKYDNNSSITYTHDAVVSCEQSLGSPCTKNVGKIGPGYRDVARCERYIYTCMWSQFHNGGFLYTSTEGEEHDEAIITYRASAQHVEVTCGAFMTSQEQQAQCQGSCED